MTHFALADAAGITAAFLLFSLLNFFPGYLLGHLLNLWQFQERTFAFRLPASVVLSISVGPALTFLTGLVVGWQLVWTAYVIASMGGLCLLIRARPKWDKTVRAAALAGLVWFAAATTWLMDWQGKSQVYFPVYGLDYCTRAAFVHSLAAFGLPARTPLFNPGHPVALHYHFLWLLQCALIHWLAPVLITARLALIAGAIWCGLGLMCVAALVMRIVRGRRSWIVIGLLAVTGLDIIPTVLLLPSNSLHLLAMLHTAMWQPHYICALIACMTGFLLLWRARGIVVLAIAAICLASAVGSGSFVALIMAAFLAGWVISNVRESMPLIVAGVLTVVLSLPYLKTLAGAAQNVENAPLLSFGLIAFSASQAPVVMKVLLLPVNYFIEFGLFGACAWMNRRHNEKALLWMVIAAIFVCTFVQSGATENNDLGWRGLLVAQFALLILSAEYLERQRPSAILKILLVAGLLGTTYDLALVRFFPILADITHGPKPKWMGTDDQLGRRTLANREAYAWLQRHSAQTALLAQNPNLDAVDVFSGLYADRNILAGDRTCTIGFGGAPAECAPLEARLTKLFAGALGFAEACSALPANFYAVKDTDPVWSQSDSWVWREKPVFANRFVRIFECARLPATR